MTSRQRDYIQAIVELASTLGYSPSLREVAEKVGTTHQSTTSAVTSLERQGLVARDYAVARSLRLTPAGRAALEGQAE
jgi:Mn-dependent DtxR family transcriptional regulator